MEINKILNADILDIIFDGKNKLYGAYELRKTYSQRIGKAILFTVILMLFTFLGTVFSSMAGKNVDEDIEVLDTRLADVKKNDALPHLPPPMKRMTPRENNQVKYTSPIIVKENDVKDDEKIEEIFVDQAIGIITIESDKKELIVQAPVNEKASQVIEMPKIAAEDFIFTRVEIEAEFTGGQQAWKRYLEKNLNPNTPFDNRAPTGTYQVIVKFIVSKDGSISDVQAETKHGFGMEEEAIKIIKRCPKWRPALQNGSNVNAYRRQPITFIVEQ